jgi:Subunit ChlI of Mg-chelatase
MLAKITNCAVVGLDGALVDVEVDVSNGQPGFTIVGLPDAAVQESCERVRAAIKNSSFANDAADHAVSSAPRLHAGGGAELRDGFLRRQQPSFVTTSSSSIQAC